jgi:hypothetical protein
MDTGGLAGIQYCSLIVLAGRSYFFIINNRFKLLNYVSVLYILVNLVEAITRNK